MPDCKECARVNGWWREYNRAEGWKGFSLLLLMFIAAAVLTEIAKMIR